MRLIGMVNLEETESSLYECDFCDFAEAWDDSDNAHGEMWGCDHCERIFCSKCFQDRYGIQRYMEMMQDWDLIVCPDCYEKVKQFTGKPFDISIWRYHLASAK